ncbi:hypothetical protein Tco_1400190 [Tanacetum coccineum]
MDDEPMWAADHVVASTLGSAITIPETANEFWPSRDTENEVVRLMMFPLSLTGEAKTWLNELNEGTIETISNTDTDKIMARMDAMTIKIDAHYKELQSRAKQPTPNLDDDDIPMSREEEAKFMQTFRNMVKIFYHGLSEITQEVLNAAAGGIFFYKTPNQAYQLLEDKVLLKLDWAKNQKTKSSLKKTVAFSDEDAQYKELQSRAKQPISDLDDDDIPMYREEEAKFIKTFQTFMDLKTQLETVAKNHQASIQNLETKFDRLADKRSGRPSGYLPSNTQPNHEVAILKLTNRRKLITSM